MSSGEYAGALESDGRDLVAAAGEGILPLVEFRDDEVGKALEHLEHRRSVLLTGPAGCGKTAVIHAIARVLHARGRGGLRQISTSQIMAGTKYIGEWQTKITAIAAAAAESSTLLYVADIWNLATVGKTSNDPSCLLDALRPMLEAGTLTLVGEATGEILRTIGRTPGFANLFQQVAVAPLLPAQVDAVLATVSAGEGLTLDAGCRRALVQTTARFMPSRPQPGPALNLLLQVRDYQAQEGAAGPAPPITPDYVERVFSIYSGLPLFVVSREATIPARDIRAWFEERIVGQGEGIAAVVEAIALFKAGLHDPERPLGTFLFVGPTGVGKTEVARALARFLFGSSKRMLRFDLSEFKDYHSFEMLVGDPERPHQPARLVDPVRTQPFQVVLFDELEKAHANVWDLLLQLLDEGRLTPPGGQPVSFRNTLVIATSNVGAGESARSLGFGATPDRDAHSAGVRKALERAFRPEFLNRFQHVVVFHPLSASQVRTIARKELGRILEREGITARNLVVDVADQALDLIIDRAFDPRYGARALKRELQRQLVLPIAVTLMERRVDPGSILRVVVKDGDIRVRLLETPASREVRREREPVRSAAGKKLSRAEIVGAVAELRGRIEVLAGEVDEEFLGAERARLLELRQQAEFWHHPEDAALALRDLDRYTAWIGRLDRLRTRADDIDSALAGADMRREVQQVSHRVEQLDHSIVETRREMVVMGAGGLWDALVEVAPLGVPGRAARDLMVETYTGWARARRNTIDWIREPASDDEAAMFAIQGAFASGLMTGEAGLHRLRVDKKTTSVVRVRVMPWSDASGTVEFVVHRALKGRGQFGGRLRSRVECRGGLVLQNRRNLTENRELAIELEPSWAGVAAGSDAIVRRYQSAPGMVRDDLTGWSSGRPDALAARSFHDLLCWRVDLLASSS